MNYKFTALILLVLVGLIGVVAYLNHQPPKKHTSATRLVFKTKPRQIQALTLTRKAAGKNGKKTLAFERAKGHWRITAPLQAAARDRVDSLVRSVADLAWRYRLKIASSGKHSLSATGLSPAKAIFTLHDKSGDTWRLAVGRHNSAGRLYVRPLGRKARHIYVVDSAWFDSFNHPAAHFRNLNLTHFHMHNIAGITIDTSGGKEPATMTLIPHGSGWVFTHPIPAPVNTSGMQDWLSDVQLLAATRFSTTSEKSAALGTGPLTIIIRFKPPAPAPTTAPAGVKTPAAKAPAPLVIHFGRYTDLTHKAIYVTSSQNPGVGVVPIGTYTPLNRPMSQFRDKALTRANLNHADHLIIKAGNSVLQMQKTGLQWNMTPQGIAATQLAARATVVGNLLKAVASLRAKSFQDGKINRAGLGLVHPIHRLSIQLSNHVHPLVIGWGTTSGKVLVPVSVSGWPSVYNVPATALNALTSASVAAFRSRTIADYSPASVLRISLPAGGTRPQVLLSQAAGKWTIARGQAAGRAAPDALVQRLLAAINPLRAKKWYRRAESGGALRWSHLPFSYSMIITQASSTSAAGKKVAPVQTTLVLIRRAMPLSGPAHGAGKAAAAKVSRPQNRWYGYVGTPQLLNPDFRLFQPHKSLIAALKAVLAPAGKLAGKPAAATAATKAASK